MSGTLLITGLPTRLGQFASVVSGAPSNHWLATCLGQLASTVCWYVWCPLWSLACPVASVSSSPLCLVPPLVTGLPICLGQFASIASGAPSAHWLAHSSRSACLCCLLSSFRIPAHSPQKSSRQKLTEPLLSFPCLFFPQPNSSRAILTPQFLTLSEINAPTINFQDSSQTPSPKIIPPKSWQNPLLSPLLPQWKLQGSRPTPV